MPVISNAQLKRWLATQKYQQKTVEQLRAEVRKLKTKMYDVSRIKAKTAIHPTVMDKKTQMSQTFTQSAIPVPQDMKAILEASKEIDQQKITMTIEGMTPEQYKAQQEKRKRDAEAHERWGIQEYGKEEWAKISAAKKAGQTIPRPESPEDIERRKRRMAEDAAKEQEEAENEELVEAAKYAQRVETRKTLERIRRDPAFAGFYKSRGEPKTYSQLKPFSELQGIEKWSYLAAHRGQEESSENAISSNIGNIVASGVKRQIKLNELKKVARQITWETTKRGAQRHKTASGKYVYKPK